MNKDIKLLVENIFQREGARELLKRSKAEEIDAQIRKMYLYHPKTREELEDNIIECLENKTDLNLIDVSEIDDFEDLFNYFSKINRYIQQQNITSIDISGWYIRSDANVKNMFERSILKEIVLPNNLQKIDIDMFYKSNLTSVTIPNSVTSINERAFCVCCYLTSVTIPDSVTSIGYNAFYWCSGLTGVYISDLTKWCAITFGNYDANPLYYAHRLYLNGSEVKDLTIPNSVTSIGEYAFKGCSGLTSVDIPNSVTSIGGCAFDGCSSLTSVTIPDSVTSIGAYAFTYYSKLTIYVNNVANFKRKFNNYRNFCKANQIKSIRNKPINENIFQRESARELLKRSKAEELDNQIRKMYLYHPTTKDELIDNIIECLENKTDLNSIDVSGITDFRKLFMYDDDYVFLHKLGLYIKNKNIEEIDISGWYINKSKTSQMFKKSTLTKVVLPNNIQEIGWEMFYQSKLTTVDIPESVTTIDNDAFCKCNDLNSINIPNSVSSIGSNAFCRCGLTKMSLPNTITEISNGLFSKCEKLESVKIPDSVMRICENAFFGCINLRNVKMSNSIKYLGSYAFAQCNLSSIYIPISIDYLGIDIFYGCSQLKTIYIDDVEKYKKKLFFNDFYEEIKNTGIIIKSINKKPINENIFQREGASELLKRSKAEELDVQIRKMYLYHPTTKEELKDNIIECFENKTDLNLIDVSEIDDFEKLFYRYKKIGEYTYNKLGIYIEDNIITSIDISGWYIRSDANVKQMFIYSTLEEIVLPNNLHKIDNDMFRNSNLTRVTIPNSVISIGMGAFYCCEDLKSVNIPVSVKTINDRVFQDCSGLTSVTIPDSVETIGEGVFCDCRRLRSVTIPNSVISIGDYAFYICPNLQTVYVEDVDEFKRKFDCEKICIPNKKIKSIKEKPINENIFQREGARELLKKSKAEEIDAQIRKMYLYHPKTREELEDNIMECLENETDLISIDVSEIDDFYCLFMYDEYSNKPIGKYIKEHKITNIDISNWNINPEADTDAMFYESTLNNVILPYNIYNIGEQMFYCSKITSCVIPDNVISIDEEAFKLSELTNLTIGKSVSKIKDNAFQDCHILTKVIIPDSVLTIGEHAFQDCHKLMELIIGNSVKNIGDRAFQDCHILKKVIIPDSVLTIGDRAFQDCHKLKELIIGNSVKTIGMGAFYSCEDLENLFIGDSVREISKYAFSKCNSLISVTIPDSVIIIEKCAFADCYKLQELTIPISVEEIDGDAFLYCDNLHIIYVDVEDVDAFKEYFSYVNFYNAEIKSIKEKPIREFANVNINKANFKLIKENIFQREGARELLKRSKYDEILNQLSHMPLPYNAELKPVLLSLLNIKFPTQRGTLVSGDVDKCQYEKLIYTKNIPSYDFIEYLKKCNWQDIYFQENPMQIPFEIFDDSLNSQAENEQLYNDFWCNFLNTTDIKQLIQESFDNGIFDIYITDSQTIYKYFNKLQSTNISIDILENFPFIREILISPDDGVIYVVYKNYYNSYNEYSSAFTFTGNTNYVSIDSKQQKQLYKFNIQQITKFKKYCNKKEHIHFKVLREYNKNVNIDENNNPYYHFRTINNKFKQEIDIPVQLFENKYEIIQKTDSYNFEFLTVDKCLRLKGQLSQNNYGYYTWDFTITLTDKGIEDFKQYEG